MDSGQLRYMIMRVYGVSQDQAEGIMDVIETVAHNLKCTYMKGVKDGFMGATIQCGADIRGEDNV